jgi:ribosomal protein S18 acetylase RimI-like enzyme
MGSAEFPIPDLPEGISLHILSDEEWPFLRDARLAALYDSPESFLSRYETEMGYSEDQWRAQFKRGFWIVLKDKKDNVSGLVGIVKASDVLPSERYLEYLWVSPQYRGLGLASSLIESIREYLRLSGITTLRLWVLNGNETAWRLYEKSGFITTHKRQPLRDRPGRYEEQMKLDIE